MEFNSEMLFRCSCWKCHEASEHRDMEGWKEVETVEVHLRFTGMWMIAKVKDVMRLRGEYTEVVTSQVLPHPGTTLPLQPNSCVFA